MIAERYMNELVFGNKPEDIEGYEDAITSDEMYVPHHVLEYKYTIDELVSMNRYDKVSADELIWMLQSVHNCNSTLHKGVRLGNDAMKGRIPWNKGKTLSEEFRQKMSKSQKGKHLSGETRKKISEAGKGRTPWNRGKQLSEEIRNKMSESHKDKHRSEEHRQKLSESNKGKCRSMETRKKIAEANKGKVLGKHWYNNGEINKRAFVCPEGFVKGRLHGSKV